MQAGTIGLYIRAPGRSSNRTSVPNLHWKQHPISKLACFPFSGFFAFSSSGLFWSAWLFLALWLSSASSFENGTSPVKTNEKRYVFTLSPDGCCVCAAFPFVACGCVCVCRLLVWLSSALALCGAALPSVCDGCGYVLRPLLTGWVIDPFPNESL